MTGHRKTTKHSLSLSPGYLVWTHAYSSWKQRPQYSSLILTVRRRVRSLGDAILFVSTTAIEVGLEKSSYSVREDVGHVEVCVVVTSPTSGCPVAYNFSVLVVNLAGSAGVCVCVVCSSFTYSIFNNCATCLLPHSSWQ